MFKSQKLYLWADWLTKIMINVFIINSVTVSLLQIYIQAAQLHIKSLFPFSCSKLLDFQTVLAPFLFLSLTPWTAEINFGGREKSVSMDVVKHK